MLTEAEREKVFYTRGFRNFCFRVGKATPHILSLQLRRVLCFCIICLLSFYIEDGFKITWYVKFILFMNLLSTIINYFWGVWLRIIIQLRQYKKTQKHQEGTQNSPSEWLEIFLQKIINKEILVIDLVDGFVLFQNKTIVILFYKGFFYDMDYYEKFKKVFFEPESAIQQLNNNSIPKE